MGDHDAVDAIVPIDGRNAEFIESEAALARTIADCAEDLAPFVPLTARNLAPLLRDFVQGIREGFEPDWKR